jgi:lysophospholipase L1-like esterase
MGATMPRRAVLAALAGAAGAALEGGARAEGASLGVIGDSLTRACRLITPAQLGSPAQLGAVGWGPIKIDGQGSRRIPASAPAPYSGVRALRAMREAGFDPTAFIIELGTNDVGYAAEHGQELRALVTELLDAINGAGGAVRRVLWVDIVRHDILRACARFNRTLDEVAALRPDQLVAYHWSRVAVDHPDWFQDDGIHLTAEGCTQRAYLVAQASRALRGGPIPKEAYPSPGKSKHASG